jgi:hypothetical protein
MALLKPELKGRTALFVSTCSSPGEELKKDGCLTSGGRQLSEGYFISFDSPLGGEIRKPSAREKGSN